MLFGAVCVTFVDLGVCWGVQRTPLSWLWLGVRVACGPRSASPWIPVCVNVWLVCVSCGSPGRADARREHAGAAPARVPASPLRCRGQLRFRLPLPTKSELRSGAGRRLAGQGGGGYGWERRDVRDPCCFPGAGPRTPPDARAARPRAPGRGNESPGRAEARSEHEKIEHRKQREGKTKSI